MVGATPAVLRRRTAQRSRLGPFEAGELCSFARRSACNGGLTLARFLVSFAGGVVYSRSLGATGRGQVAFVIGAASLLSLVAGAGLVPGVKRLRAGYGGGDLDRAATSVVLLRAAGLAASWCAVCIAGNFAGLLHVDGGQVVAIAGLVPLAALPHAAIATAAVDRREVRLSIGMLVGALVLVATLGLLVAGAGVTSTGVLLAWGLSIGLPSLWSLRRAVRRRSTGGVLRALHAASTRTGLTELGLYAMWRVDTLLVAHMLGYRELGRYAVTTSVAEGLMAVMHGVRLWALGNHGGPGASTARTSAAIKLGLVAGAPVALGLALVGPAGIAAVFGAEFEGLGPALWLLLPGVLVLGSSFVVADELAVVGATRASSRMVLSGLALNVVLGVVLIPRFGIEGAAAASSAAYVWSFTQLGRMLRLAGRERGAGR